MRGGAVVCLLLFPGRVAVTTHAHSRRTVGGKSCGGHEPVACRLVLAVLRPFVDKAQARTHQPGQAGRIQVKDCGGVAEVLVLRMDRCVDSVRQRLKVLQIDKITINVPVVYMVRYKVVLWIVPPQNHFVPHHINNRCIGCFMYQPWTYNMRIYMPMYVLCNMPF